MINRKKFYEDYRNFSYRTLSEYFISPGIRCKFDILKEYIGKRKFNVGIDLGCSGNSFLCFLENLVHKSFFDLAFLPLKQYSKTKLKRLKIGNIKQICYFHPLCGDLTQLPYRDKVFDFILALDVLEHVKNDKFAISELNRVLKKNGIAIITVPHKMKYYTNQDRLIGHYRRYEIQQINSLFAKYNLKNIRTFGVYGQCMKIADIQSTNPEKIEKSLLNLRNRYESNAGFRKFWEIIVKISAKIMKIDAKYHSLKKIMNIALIFEKI
ncbi:MAG: class I SAM-dependent methyltransferase [Promethearchaeota archaeon]